MNVWIHFSFDSFEWKFNKKKHTHTLLQNRMHINGERKREKERQRKKKNSIFFLTSIRIIFFYFFLQFNPIFVLWPISHDIFLYKESQNQFSFLFSYFNGNKINRRKGKLAEKNLRKLISIWVFQSSHKWGSSLYISFLNSMCVCVWLWKRFFLHFFPSSASVYFSLANNQKFTSTLQYIHIFIMWHKIEKFETRFLIIIINNKIQNKNWKKKMKQTSI